jgi:phosphoribosylaminoimidazole-succinocarboxamide synthase
MSTPIVTTTLALPLAYRGKVRDVYHLGDRLLVVTTDRISAFDVVLPTPVPDKGKVLTALSLWWFDVFQDIPNHLAEDQKLPTTRFFSPDDPQLKGRTMIVDRLDMHPVECVARGFIAGSAWAEYKESGSVCGIKLRPGLREADKLDEPIFTPATKAAEGHDRNITFDEMTVMLGSDAAEAMRATTLDIYRRAAAICEDRGILLADTKLEFGVLPWDEAETPILADELLSPDSSRFWAREQWRAGISPPSFDKQFVRDYLSRMDWDRTPPAPSLPEHVLKQTREKYFEAYRRLTGSVFHP